MKTKLIAVPIPAKYNWRAIDSDGERRVFTRKPKPFDDADFDWWDHGHGGFMVIGRGEPCPDWRNTLERIVEIEYV